MIPKNASPPYQAIIFFPGSYAQRDEKLTTRSVAGTMGFIVNSGRAAIYPVYYGTYERNLGTNPNTGKTHEYTEFLIKLVKDFSRTIDYLETRPDIDTSKLGYWGHSWGGNLGAIIPAVEDRLSLSFLQAAGFSSDKPFPEADEMNYVTRVKVPTVMFNGSYDGIFPLETNARIFFNLLGMPEKDKKLYLIDAGHNFYRKDMIGPFLDWCDKYFGPVNYLKNE